MRHLKKALTMDVLLRNITLEELSQMYDRHSESSTPFLKDPAAIRRAKQLAKKMTLRFLLS